MGLLKKIQYNCKKATYLIEKKAIAEITFVEEIELRIHLAGCGVCVLYKKQSKLINNMVLQLFGEAENNTKTYFLDDNYKQQLQVKIEEKLKK